MPLGVEDKWPRHYGYNVTAFLVETDDKDHPKMTRKLFTVRRRTDVR